MIQGHTRRAGGVRAQQIAAARDKRGRGALPALLAARQAFAAGFVAILVGGAAIDHSAVVHAIFAVAETASGLLSLSAFRIEATNLFRIVAVRFFAVRAAARTASATGTRGTALA